MVIGISGKIGSGKDTIGKIVQYLIVENQRELNNNDEWGYNSYQDNNFIVKKFADKLKDIVCILIGCTREQLEDREFKEGELEEEWWYWSVYDGVENKPYYFSTEEEAQKRCLEIWGEDFETYIELVKLTPRKLLQLLGTDAGRDIIHPNIWVNALFSTYKPISYNSIPNNDSLYGESYTEIVYPNWVITDMRFPNELKAVKDRGGITIRVNRLRGPLTGNRLLHISEKENIGQHSSETALDNAEFDYVIDNNGTIEELIRKVKEILIKEKII